VSHSYQSASGDQVKMLIASTASPFKFTRSVMNAINQKYDSMSDFELVDELSALSGVRVPQAIEEIRSARVLHDTVCAADKMQETVEKILKL
jgi:threonine synthase